MRSSRASAVSPTASSPTSPAPRGSRTGPPSPAGARWPATSSPARAESRRLARASPRSPLAVVAEGLVPLAHRLTEADVTSEVDEVETFLGMTSDAVEQASEQARGIRLVLLRRLVAQQLDHLQLIERQASHAPGQAHGGVEQLRIGDALEHEPDQGRL